MAGLSYPSTHEIETMRRRLQQRIEQTRQARDQAHPLLQGANERLDAARATLARGDARLTHAQQREDGALKLANSPQSAAPRTAQPTQLMRAESLLATIEGPLQEAAEMILAALDDLALRLDAVARQQRALEQQLQSLDASNNRLDGHGQPNAWGEQVDRS